MATTYKQQKQERSAPGIEGFLRNNNYQDLLREDGSTQWRIANEDAPHLGIMENNLEGARSPFNEYVNDPYVGDRYYIDRQTVENPGMGYSNVGYRPEFLQADENGETYIPAALQREWHQKVYAPNHRNSDEWVTMMPLAFMAAAGGAAAAGGLGAGAGAAGGSSLGTAAGGFGSALAGTEAAAMLAPAIEGGLTAGMIPGLGTGVSFGAVPGATLGSIGAGGLGGAGAGGLGMLGETSWLGDFMNWGGGGGGGGDPSGVMGDFGSSFNTTPSFDFKGIDFSNFNTNLFPSSTGGLSNSITPNWLTQGGSGTAFGADGGLGGLSGSVSGLGNGGGFWDSLGSILKNPQIPGMPNSTGANIASSLANYFMRSQQQDQLNSAATQAAQLNNPMNQPQRLPFQAAYANLLLNPNSYQQTPYAQGMTNQVNNAFQSNVAKYGPSGTVFSDYLKNYQNVLGQDYYKLADQLGQAGGFNQGTGGAGSVFGGLAGQAANVGNAAFEGFGKLLSNTNDSTTPKSFTVTTNPNTGATTYSL